MSANFQPAAGLSEKAEKILTEFANSGSCESSGVADILNVIAENGDEMSEDATLINAAYEIIGSAHAFINRLTGYTKLVCPQCGSGDVKDAGSLFFEKGEFDGKHYQEEGSADVYSCQSCRNRFITLGAEVEIVDAPGMKVSIQEALNSVEKVNKEVSIAEHSSNTDVNAEHF